MLVPSIHQGNVTPMGDSALEYSSKLFLAVALLATLALQGCTVLAVADTVGTVAVKSVGLVADAALGVVSITGKAVGAALPGDE